MSFLGKEVKVADITDLLSLYVGQSAEKTLRYLESNRGSVIFAREISLGLLIYECYKSIPAAIRQFMEDNPDTKVIFVKEPEYWWIKREVSAITIQRAWRAKR